MEMASASTILELRKLQPASHPAGCWSVVTGGWQVATAGDTWGRCRYCSGPAVQLALGSWQLAVGKCTPLSHAIVARPAMIIFQCSMWLLRLLPPSPNAPPTIAKDSSQPHTVLCHVRVPLAAWQEVLPGALSSVDSHGGPALEKYAPQNLASASVQDTGRTQVDWTR
ncbi:hypothetical protein E4U35_002484 [Claviceps purpurea]|nr:hypothetical protein E4U35_002484 [Claviceps purpurea]KAG6208759.1 hypothetical protein E4U34_007766 [Claviceps purpurea]